MKLGIIIETKKFEKSWNAMRFAVTAKKNGHEVGGELLACGTCLKSRNMDGSDVCPLSTMIDCLKLVDWADKTVTF